MAEYSEEEIAAAKGAQEDIAALLEEASRGLDHYDLIRDVVGTLYNDYIEAAQHHINEGNTAYAFLLSAAADDFHTIWHMVDNAIRENSDEEEEAVSDHSHTEN